MQGFINGQVANDTPNRGVIYHDFEWELIPEHDLETCVGKQPDVDIAHKTDRR